MAPTQRRLNKHKGAPVKVEVVECNTDQLSIIPKDLQLGKVERLITQCFQWFKMRL
ncbi:hypothetical protein SO802_031788 [Lithocarpus litseifolius]|uniref:Uncharacterized protein n=1 Tax=Lithocarpus litseifolius TaxID=425828 RepID=A0AAW2BNX6_9ROSI